MSGPVRAVRSGVATTRVPRSGPFGAADPGPRRLPAAAVLAVGAAFAVYLLAGAAGEGVLSAIAYSVTACAGVALLGLRASRMTSNRTPWVLLTAGAALLIGCQLALIWHGSAHGSPVELAVVREHPLLAVGGLLAYPLLYAGQMVLLRERVEQLFPSAWLDGLLAALILGAVTLAFAGPPLAHRFDLSTPAVLALLGRPALDLLLLSFAAANWSLSGRGADRRLPMLAGVFALLTAADLVGVADVLKLIGPLSTAATGHAVDAGRLLALMLLTAAAAGRPAGEVEPMPEGSAVLIGPVLSLVCGVGLVVVDRFHRVDASGLYLALAAVTGVGVKFVLLFREIVALTATRRQALTDDLTGLGNRRALTRGLDDLTTAAAGDVSLLVIDLDGFKEVNDRHGHLVGDQLLRLVADRLRAAVLPPALIARLGGDEFAVLLPGAGPATALALAGRVRDSLAGLPDAPATPDDPATPDAVAGVIAAAGPGHGVALPAVGASIGIAHTPNAGSDPEVRAVRAIGAVGAVGAVGAAGAVGEELLRQADLAMYVAKTTGCGVSVYDEALDAAQHEHSVLLDELRAALAPWSSGNGPVGSGTAEQIVAHYQPQLDTRTGAVVGVEALVRWQHPRLGLLSPDAFLDLAEQHGLMASVTACMLQTAAEQAVRWRAGGSRLRVSVNLSTSSLLSPDLLPRLDDVLTRTGLPPAALVLEITETTLMAEPELALEMTRCITARGVGLSIDDYGTGYSSLAYLNDLPATEIKLDRSFTRRLIGDDRTAAIVSATIDLAHRLGCEIVAEGVEDADTLQRLGELGCDTTQGFLHSRPLPPPALTRWLAAAARRDRSGSALLAGASEPGRPGVG